MTRDDVLDLLDAGHVLGVLTFEAWAVRFRPAASPATARRAWDRMRAVARSLGVELVRTEDGLRLPPGAVLVLERALARLPRRARPRPSAAAPLPWPPELAEGSLAARLREAARAAWSPGIAWDVFWASLQRGDARLWAGRRTVARSWWRDLCRGRRGRAA